MLEENIKHNAESLKSKFIIVHHGVNLPNQQAY